MRVLRVVDLEKKRKWREIVLDNCQEQVRNGGGGGPRGRQGPEIERRCEMNGLERYRELIGAQGKVVAAMDAIMTEERLSPAWYKALRVTEYLKKQAANVMEGLTEDGAENGADALEIMWKAVAAGEPAGKRCNDEWDDIAGELDAIRAMGHCNTVFPTPMLANPHREETMGGGRGGLGSGKRFFQGVEVAPQGWDAVEGGAL